MSEPRVPARAVSRVNLLSTLKALQLVDRGGYLCYCAECRNPLQYQVTYRDVVLFVCEIRYTLHGRQCYQRMPLERIEDLEAGDYGYFANGV